MNPFYQTLLFLLGTCLASFINACSMRLLEPKETIFDPSRCRSCDQQLKFWQLIPVFSWLLQKGKCGCKKMKPISPQYFLTEICLGCLFLGVSFIMPWGLEFAFILIFLSIGFFIFLTDVDKQLLHFPTLIFGIICGLIFTYLFYDIWRGLFGAGLGFFTLYLINWIFMKFKNRQGFGDGDKYLLAMLGAWFGPILVLQSLVLSSWLGIIFMGCCYLKSKTILKKIAYGPFLVSAAVLIQINQYLSFI